jgi:hypothetical protein
VDRQGYIQRTTQYLEASGARRLEEAQPFLADDVVLQFPGGTYRSLAELARDATGRYRSIGKTHDSWDVAEHDGAVTVISVGTLYGENVHGVKFSGVRYIDRLVYRDERIVLQQVWNDLAESGVLERKPG